MLTHPTLEKLQHMRLFGMATAFGELLEDPAARNLTFEEKFGLLVDREETDRADRRLQRRLKRAKFDEPACMEDVNYEHKRGLDKAQMRGLATCRWVREHHNVIFVGPTGTGKTWLSCALGHKTCLEGFKAEYHKLHALLTDLEMARADGRYLKIARRLARTHVLILDDWGLQPLTDLQRRTLLEIIDDRRRRGSTICTSQYPLENWHEAIGESTLADAILDRIVHNAYKFTLTGESMRKICSPLTPSTKPKTNH